MAMKRGGVFTPPLSGIVYDDFYLADKEGTLPPYRRFVNATGLDNPYLSESYIENLKSESVKVSEEIETIQGSVAWKWYHTESVEERAQILKLYIAFIEKQKYENVKESKLILGLGHPRTGTGYTSNLLKTWGLDVGHEKMGADGIIAWQLVSDIEPRIFMEDFDSSRYTYKYLIYNVRDPRGSIPSIALTENEGNARLSAAFPKTHIVIVGIEKVIPSVTDLGLLWPLLSTYGTGQQVRSIRVS